MLAYLLKVESFFIKKKIIGENYCGFFSKRLGAILDFFFFYYFFFGSVNSTNFATFFGKSSPTFLY
jgi:hypothetical protein